MVQPAIVVGLVSGAGLSPGSDFNSLCAALGPGEVVACFAVANAVCGGWALPSVAINDALGESAGEELALL